jgi:hypothetical protein
MGIYRKSKSVVMETGAFFAVIESSACQASSEQPIVDVCTSLLAQGCRKNTACMQGQR